MYRNILRKQRGRSLTRRAAPAAASSLKVPYLSCQVLSAPYQVTQSDVVNQHDRFNDFRDERRAESSRTVGRSRLACGTAAVLEMMHAALV